MCEIKVNTDIEEHLSCFVSFRNKFEEAQNEKRNINRVIECLNEEINTLKLSEQTLRNQLLLLTSCADEQSKVTSLYDKLKAQYNELDRKYTKVERENLFLQQNHFYEQVELEDKFKAEKDKVTQEYSNKIKTLENTINQQSAELQKKEKEHQVEVERLNSVCGIQYDEMESYLKTQLRDATFKLQESNSTANMLRQELIMCKSDTNTQIATLRKNNQDLRSKVSSLEQELDLLQQFEDRLPMRDTELSFTRKNTIEVNSNPSASGNYRKKQAKYVSLQRNDTHNIESPGYSRLSQSDCINVVSKEPKKKTFAPPLIQLNKSNKNSKKRKLYNLNSSISEFFEEGDGE